MTAAEGPIADERLARLVAGAFDLTRLNAARIQSILRCVPPSMRDGNGFVWPDSLDRSTWTAFRTATADSPRPVADVSPQEMANAIIALCRDAHGMTEDELYRETLALFGWKRRTEAMVAPVRAGLDLAFSLDRLTRRPDGMLTSAWSAGCERDEPE